MSHGGATPAMTVRPLPATHASLGDPSWTGGHRDATSPGPSRAEPDARWSELHDTLRPALLRWLERHLRDDAGAEDLCQDAFLRLWREVCAGRDPVSPAAWLRRVAMNLAISQRRRQHLPMTCLSVPWDVVGERTGGPDPVIVAVLSRERYDAVRAAFESLPDPERSLLLLGAAGLSAREIGGRLGCSQGAARVRLYRSRQGLRRLADEPERA
jgi:RNA polymerase sigma-70 factor (ECF subfamily)